MYLYEQNPLSDFQFILARALHIDTRYFGWIDCISVEKTRELARAAMLFESVMCLMFPIHIYMKAERGRTDLGTLVYKLLCSNLTRVLPLIPGVPNS